MIFGREKALVARTVFEVMFPRVRELPLCTTRYVKHVASYPTLPKYFVPSIFDVAHKKYQQNFYDMLHKATVII